MNIGDIVVVIDTQSLPETYLGRYGRIEDVSDYKITVEFQQRVNNRGRFLHTAFPSDLKKVGDSNY